MLESRPKVMILDSDVDALPSLYHLLSEQGCQVATYTSPLGACPYAAEEKPDVILISLGFPGREGLAVIRQLKNASPDSRVLLLEPAGHWPDLPDAAGAGVDALLSKPADGEELLRRLNDLLEAPCFAVSC